jgi:hypothetical protein
VFLTKACCGLPAMQEVAVWYTKCRNEKQGRQVAESALQDTLGECCVVPAQQRHAVAWLSTVARSINHERMTHLKQQAVADVPSSHAHILALPLPDALHSKSDTCNLYCPVQSLWSSWSRSVLASAACYKM